MSIDKTVGKFIDGVDMRSVLTLLEAVAIAVPFVCTVIDHVKDGKDRAEDRGDREASRRAAAREDARVEERWRWEQEDRARHVAERDARGIRHGLELLADDGDGDGELA